MAVYSNSSLINYTKLSPNKTAKRNHKIDTITIHCMAGNLTVARCGELFADPARKASSNYGIGSDGKIGLYVPEESRSWASSSAANDNRAITIEVANDDAGPIWHVSDKAMESLINLLVDICKRNDIPSLKWKNDRILVGVVEKQNMTVHRWFANKSCPGEYLIGKMGWIASEVNKRLNPPAPEEKSEDKSFLVRIAVHTLNIRKGPGTSYGTTGTVSKSQIYTIVDTSPDGKWGKLKSGAGWISLAYTEIIK